MTTNSMPDTPVAPNPSGDDVAPERRAQVHYDLVVAANRLPVRRDDNGDWTLNPGGFVTALRAVMRGRDAAWIGWDGVVDGTLDSFRHEDLALHPLALNTAEHRDYFEGFSNQTLWPLYHHGSLPTNYLRRWWRAYRTVNERFAVAAAETLADGASLWVQDYHLQLLPEMVRRLRPDVRIGFFLHTPLAPSAFVMRLPWREEICRGLLGADVVGFQTTADARNFISLAHRVVGTPEVLLEDAVAEMDYDGRPVRVGAYPISVDVAAIEAIAVRPEAGRRAQEFRESLGNPRRLVLGIDRLDSTKGIDARLKAFRELLDEGAVDPAEVTFVQVATPGRNQGPGYLRMRRAIERQVGRINGDHATLGGPVVHYLYHSFPFDELVAMYMAADVMVVTPYSDGMNLVAKEYVATRIDRTGALVLSEFAGTAVEFSDALLCNPYDTLGLKNVLKAALDLDPEEQAWRMESMQRCLRAHTVHDWAREFLRELK